ncbi:hypothetical protein F5883DRAFT_542128 [Diaporthe sp. PMI_573]|nr:hypothetical protein F5883DRAFT_542128 [Diaporthaceae sp. PMI_573]
MKFYEIGLAAVAIFSHALLVEAGPVTPEPYLEARGTYGSCNTFTLYCGHTLKSSRGWSNSNIIEAVKADSWNSGRYPNDNQIGQSLFKCAGQGNSLVWVNNQVPCANCVDAGSGHSDYCG